MEKVKIGILGCGVIGKLHLKFAKASSLMEVAAVADLQEDAARNAAEEFGVKRSYTDAARLFADPQIEAVILATPTFGRAALALQAFAAEKHVLIEKPVAMNAGEVEQMIKAGKGLVAGCCSSRYHFLPSAAASTRFIAGGGLGELSLLRRRVISTAGERPGQIPPAWRLKKSLNGGGIAVNWGCYDLDYLLGVTGWLLKPRMVLAKTWKIPPRLESHIAPGSDAETHFVATIICESGPVIVMERGEYMVAQPEETCEIIGSNGSLDLMMLPMKNKKIIHNDASPEKGMVSQTIWQGDEDYDMINAGLLDDFAAAVREGRQPRTSIEKALVIQRVTDAIYASAEQGRAIEINCSDVLRKEGRNGCR